MKSYDNSKGFTLLEMLVALTLTTIITASGMAFYSKMSNQSITQEEISDMQQNTRATLDEIVSTLRIAGYKLSGHAPYKISGDSLWVFSSDTQPVDTVLYYLQSYSDWELRKSGKVPEGFTPSHLMKKVNSGAAMAFSDHIRSLAFNQIDSSTIEVQLATQSTKSDIDLTENNGYRLIQASERVELRNVRN